MTGEEERPDSAYLVADVAEWLRKTMTDDLEVLGDFRDLTPAICGFKKQRPLKDAMAVMLSQAMIYCGKQNEMLQELQHDVATMKTELVTAQKRIIDLQDELLASKNVQLQSLQTTVKTSVKDTVQAEFLSYSEVVQKQPAQTLEHDVVKTLVKTVVEEEDRSRSILIFGLEDEVSEDLQKKCGDVFLEIGEQPRAEVSRLGKFITGGKARPVKVCLSSSGATSQILSKARDLKQSEKYSRVFICPDISPAQWSEHRRLVEELKKKRREEPGQRFFIKRGTVVTGEK